MAKVQQFSEECHALSDRCQAAVGMYRKGISDDVRGKPYVRPIVRGKEVKKVEFGAKCNNIQVDGMSFILPMQYNWQGESRRQNLARQSSHIHVKQCPSCKG